MSDRTLRRIHVGILAVAVPLFVSVVFLSTLNGSFGEDGAFIGLAMLMIVGYVSLASLLIRRQPRNPIGWLMLTIGLGFLVGGATDEYGKYTFRTEPGALPFGETVAWVGSWIFVLFVLPIPFLFSLFPTGRPQSPRWRWVLRLAVASAAGLILATILQPGLLDTDYAPIPNPTGIPALATPIDVLEWVAGLGLLLAAILSAVSLVIRARRSSGEERQQVRWLAYATVVGVTLIVLGLLTAIGLGPGETNAVNDVIFFTFFVVLAFGIPGAVAIAILRYRLYDLDVVIKKTLVFGVLVVLLTAVSVFLVVVVGALVGRTGVLESRESGFVYFFTLGALIVPLWRLSKRLADRLVYGGRASPYEVLTVFSDRMADAYATDDVLPRMARVVVEAVGAEHAEVWLRVGDSIRPAGAWPDPASHGTVAIRGDALPELGDADAFEVRHRGDLLGAVTLAMPANDPMNPAKERLVRDLAAQAGLVLRNVRLIEELRASRQRLVSAQDQERRRLERNIHDGAQQQLVALAVKLRLADGLVDRDPAAAHEMLRQLQEETNHTLEDLRDLARGIYPPLLADEGLGRALEAQARRAAIPIEVETDGVGRYEPDVEAAVYFTCLEALGNVAKHAGASHVVVRVERDDGTLRFEVRDDGIGFDPVVATRGTGLQGIADRLEAIGGALEVESEPGHGTTLRGIVPIRGVQR